MEWYDDPRNKHPMDVESERDALRAEVEVYKRAVSVMATRIRCLDCPGKDTCDFPNATESCEQTMLRAISEAGKDKEGEG